MRWPSFKEWIREIVQADRARELPGVQGRVHYDDTMLGGETPDWVESYLSAGTSALDAIERGLGASGRKFSDVRRCLDFGCGYGRILRQLCERIPARWITAMDLDPVAVRFCRNEFGVRTRISSRHIDDLRLASYDLIWVGSVFTHLPPADVDRLLEKLGGALSPGGVLVFSSHGEWSVTNLSHFYGAEFAAESEQIYQEYLDVGISYRGYAQPFRDEPQGSYGMTWMNRAYLADRIVKIFEGRLKQRDYNPQGWHGHHDTITVQREP